MHADEEYEIRNTTITTTQSKKKKYNAHAYVKQISLSLSLPVVLACLPSGHRTQVYQAGESLRICSLNSGGTHR